MTRIALVTEGKSEHWIIKHIVQNYFKDEEIFFRQIQPQVFDDTQEEIGGWLEVLKFCSRTEDVNAALVESDYLIIQIDTDESNNPNFNVPHTKQGSIPKTNEELYNDVVMRIRGIIGSELESEYRNKIIFAVCIHSIECWLLPIYYTNNHKADIRNCLPTLNNELRRRNLGLIPPKKQREKRHNAYMNILRNWRRRKDIVTASQHNQGFSNFVQDLSEIELAT